MRPGVVAAFCIAGAALIIVGLYIAHRWILKQQERRYKTTFAARVAETVSLRATRRTLTPDVLAKEFAKIGQDLDEHQNGYITKEALWEFVSSGQAGEMDEKDFNALFAALDVDKNEKVDFLEFCNFLSTCGQEYGAARTMVAEAQKERSYDAAARRVSAASTHFLEKQDVDLEAEEDVDLGAE